MIDWSELPDYIGEVEYWLENHGSQTPTDDELWPVLREWKKMPSLYEIYNLFFNSLDTPVLDAVKDCANSEEAAYETAYLFVRQQQNPDFFEHAGIFARYGQDELESLTDTLAEKLLESGLLARYADGLTLDVPEHAIQPVEIWPNGSASEILIFGKNIRDIDLFDAGVGRLLAENELVHLPDIRNLLSQTMIAQMEEDGLLNTVTAPKLG